VVVTIAVVRDVETAAERTPGTATLARPRALTADNQRPMRRSRPRKRVEDGIEAVLEDGHVDVVLVEPDRRTARSRHRR
jgi:hypothetical protein